MKLFEYNDGGRKDAGYKGSAGDCVTRSIAIATQKPYQEVYDELFEAGKEYAENRRDRIARRLRDKGASPRNGVYRKVYESYLKSLGWNWIPTMKIGSGCKVHLTPWELPEGRLIVRLSKHITTMIDGVINDTHDPSRGGTRCVYGYFKKGGE